MLSIIIITLNEEKRLPILLDCLAKQTLKDFEVIVVDGNSKDLTKKAALSYRKKLRVKFFTQPKKGVSLARNTGAAHAQGEFLLFMDADITFKDDFLERCLTGLNNQDLGAAGIYMLPIEKGAFNYLTYGFLDMWFFLMQWIYPHVVGSAMIASKKAHKKIKGFDSRITLAEDNDYANRAGKHFKFRMLPVSVCVSSRRFSEEGRIRLLWKYLLVFFYRVFRGEITTDAFKYRFGHYKQS